MALNGLFCADVPLRNYSLTLALDVPLGWGVNASTTFGGHWPLMGGQKTFKNRCNLRQFSSLGASLWKGWR